MLPGESGVPLTPEPGVRDDSGSRIREPGVPGDSRKKIREPAF